jgi:hypothetical protein
MEIQRQQVLEQLEREFTAATGFVRIHAAEVLCEHGYGHKVTAAMLPEAESIEPGYRLGVWRVLARVAKDDAERQRYIERIRRVMLDEAAPDRAGAAESLAKLGVADRADRAPLEQWLTQADGATAVFPLWLRLLSSTETERRADEARLASYLTSNDVIARMRAGYALGRTFSVSAETMARIQRRAGAEPAGSPARVYLIAAAYLRDPEIPWLKKQLLGYLDGKANEQFEVGTVLGMRGSVSADLPDLARLLKSPDADGRIGAAGALLHLLK